LPEGFFVFRFFRSICGLVVKKYLEGGDKKEANILKIVFIKFKLFYRGGKKLKRILKVFLPVMLLVILVLGGLSSVAAESKNVIRTRK
jgi:hypothetical protein